LSRTTDWSRAQHLEIGTGGRLCPGIRTVNAVQSRSERARTGASNVRVKRTVRYRATKTPSTTIETCESESIKTSVVSARLRASQTATTTNERSLGRVDPRSRARPPLERIPSLARARRSFVRVEARAREVTVNTRDFNASKTVFDARHARERKIPRTIPPTADRRPWRDAARRARADDEETATRTHRECIKQTDLELARDAIAAACAGRRAHTRDVQTTGGSQTGHERSRSITDRSIRKPLGAGSIPVERGNRLELGVEVEWSGTNNRLTRSRDSTRTRH